MQNKRVLITGATGFIGTHLVNRLLSDEWNVHIVVRENTDVQLALPSAMDVRVHQYDGTFGCMLSIMETVKPLTVFHLASMFKAEHESEDISFMLKSNIELGTHLVEAMAKNKVVHLINTGTSWQHFQNEDYNPVCLYAATKQAYEDILRYYVEAFPIKVVNLKLYDSYGPDDRRSKLFTLLARAENSNTPLEMSEGHQLIDLVYIDDIINAFMLAQQYQLHVQTSKMDTFAVSSCNPMPLRDIVELYSDVLNKELYIEWGKRSYRKREVMKPWDKGQLVPGWGAQVTLSQGIKMLVHAKTYKEIGY